MCIVSVTASWTLSHFVNKQFNKESAEELFILRMSDLPLPFYQPQICEINYKDLTNGSELFPQLRGIRFGGQMSQICISHM